jgi:hypothetical protein
MTMARGGQSFRREMVPRVHGMNASQDSLAQPHEKDYKIDMLTSPSGEVASVVLTGAAILPGEP